MLDLKELERRLDEALANETSETLSNWLINQRKNNIKSFFGNGCFVDLQEIPYTFNQQIQKNNFFNKNCKNNLPDKGLLKAA